MTKTALVTGASRGIGAACALSLSKSGYKVYINYDKNKDLAERIAAKAGGIAVQADVSDSASVYRMLDITGVVQTLVCCAGVAHYGLFTDVTDDIWKRVFEINVGGVINCCRTVIPDMIRAKDGCIITMSSIWGITGASCETIYSSSKAAVIGLSKSLAKELAPSGIRVNCVAPGVIATDMLSELTEEDLASLRNETPLGKLGTPEDIASLVSFLVSPEASFITGQVISPNGGYLI